MTGRRYRAYRKVCGELERLTPDALSESEKELLRDAAEGLLLAGDPDLDQVEELRGTVAVALSLLVDQDRWTEAAADETWDALVACGPDEPVRTLAKVV